MALLLPFAGAAKRNHAMRGLKKEPIAGRFEVFEFGSGSVPAHRVRRRVSPRFCGWKH